MPLIERFTAGGNIYMDGQSTFATLVQFFRRQAESRDARDAALAAEARLEAATTRADIKSYVDHQVSAVQAGEVADSTIDAAIDRAVASGRVAAASAFYDKLLPARTIGFGDSITEAGSNPNSSGQGERSYFAQATILSGQQLRYYRNAGIAGNTVEQMWARIETDVIDHHPDRVIFMGGTNNMGQVDQASTRLHVRMILGRLLSAGIWTAVVSIPPGDGLTQAGRDRITAHNTYLREQAAAHGMAFIDVHSKLVDAATGGFIPEYTTDGVHLTVAGARLAAQTVANALRDRFPVAPTYTALTDADADNLLSGGTFATTTGSTPTGWMATTSAGTVTAVSESGVRGRAVELTRTSATGTLSINQNITTGIKAGDRFCYAVRFKPLSDNVEYSIFAQAADASYTVKGMFRPVRTWTGGYPGYVTAFIEGVFPEGADRLQAYMHTSAGVGAIRFAEPKVKILTAAAALASVSPSQPQNPTWPTYPATTLVTSNSDPASILANPLFADADSNGTPDSWVTTNAPTRATVSVGTDATVTGNYVRITRAESSGTYSVSQTVTGGFAAGNTVQAAVKFRSTNSAVTVNFYVIAANDSYTTLHNAQILSGWAGATDGFRTATGTFTVPAGTTRMVYYMSTAAGVGSVEWAQATLRKV